jgi:hypothetical protein
LKEQLRAAEARADTEHEERTKVQDKYISENEWRNGGEFRDLLMAGGLE